MVTFTWHACKYKVHTFQQLYLCDDFRALINSLECWFCMIVQWPCIFFLQNSLCWRNALMRWVDCLLLLRHEGAGHRCCSFRAVIGGSCHKYHYCRDVMTNTFVMTNTCFLWQSRVCHDKTHLYIVLLQQKFCHNKNILSQQTSFCQDKSFFTANVLSLQQKTCFVVTKTCLSFVVTK